MRNTMTLSFILMFCIAVLPQESTQSENLSEAWILSTGTNNVSYAWANGRAWKTYDGQMKIMTVSGIEQGTMLIAREAYLAESTPANGARLNRLLDNLTVHGFHMSDITAQIDRFYDDSSNIRVPIGEAYRFALKKMHGSDSKELDSLAVTLRKTYNQ